LREQTGRRNRASRSGWETDNKNEDHEENIGAVIGKPTAWHIRLRLGKERDQRLLGGSYQEAQSKALFEPAAANSGIVVKQETYGGMSDVRLRVSSGAVSLDMVASYWKSWIIRSFMS
jgi:hypothetical protein